MRKKIIKIIESAIPRVYDSNGELLSRKDIANKIIDLLPNPEVLDLRPFEIFIPFICSTCDYYNGKISLGCTYDLMSENTHKENPAPKNCPLGYK